MNQNSIKIKNLKSYANGDIDFMSSEITPSKKRKSIQKEKMINEMRSKNIQKILMTLMNQMIKMRIKTSQRVLTVKKKINKPK